MRILFLLLLILGVAIYNSSNGNEGFEIKDSYRTDAFCKANSSNLNELNNKCKKVPMKSCKKMGCCVFTSDKECVGGSKHGPIFNTDKNGKTRKLDYFYFEDKCYGEGCK
jgi:hypothetical protein